MKKHFFFLFSWIVISLSAFINLSVYADGETCTSDGTCTDGGTTQNNQYAAGYSACQSKYDEKDTSEYSNCIAKAKCTVDNPGQTDYCDCVGNGGIVLNTDVPFVGKCINKNDTQNAFPSLIGGISKIVVTAILVVSFMMIIAGGVMRTTGNAKDGKGLITKVVIGLAILGASGAILRLINPNFFK